MNKNNKYKYRGGSSIDIQEWENPITAYKKLHRFLKDDGMFVELNERQHYEKKSVRDRKKKHQAQSRERNRWRKIEEEVGKKLRYKSLDRASNRGKKTNSAKVKKNRDC